MIDAGETGDPFRGCEPLPVVVEHEPERQRPRDPCNPSPCGFNAQCHANGETPSCQCIDGYVGLPPNCRPECVTNNDCPAQHACINSKCQDPCPNSCGSLAECHVISHTVSCVCPPSYIGNPFVECIPGEIVPLNPCEPTPCGSNAECTQRNGAGSCRCIEDYHGNPYEGCRPECVLSSDCPSDRACIRNKCKDPCPGICGRNAECLTVNHVPTCICINGYTGDAFTACDARTPEPPIIIDVCRPTPCGPNSICHEVNGGAVCSCEIDYIGTPPNCQPECTVNAECPQNKACSKFKCTNPCTGACGVSAGNFVVFIIYLFLKLKSTVSYLFADCHVINHNPICSCPNDLVGDPFVRCYHHEPVIPTQKDDVNPCIPSPCGLNAECRPNGNNPSCSCLPNYFGAPPNCRPECVVNTDCPSDKSCIAERCRNPCEGSCGVNSGNYILSMIRE